MSQLTLKQAFPFENQIGCFDPEIQHKVRELYLSDQSQKLKDNWLVSGVYFQIFHLICDHLDDLSQLIIPFPIGVHM